jgi:hypothetical protein
VISCLFQNHRRALAVSVASVSFASTSATRDTSRFAPSPSISLCHRPFLRAAAAPPLSTRGLAVSMLPFKGPGDSPRGNQPTLAPIFPLSALGCARLLFGVELRRRQATSSWTATLHRPCADAVPMAEFATFPRTSLSPSRRPGPPACPRPCVRRSSTREPQLRPAVQSPTFISDRMAQIQIDQT